MEFRKLKTTVMLMLLTMVTMAGWMAVHQYYDNQQNKILKLLIENANCQTQVNTVQDNNLELLRQVVNKEILTTPEMAYYGG